MGKFSLSLEEIEKQISLVDGSKTQAALDNRKNNPQLIANLTQTQNNTQRGVVTSAPISVNGQKANATISDDGAQITYPDGTGYWYEPNTQADPRERLSFSDWKKGTNTLQTLQEQSEAAKTKSLYNQSVNSADSELSANLQRWSSPDYKMTDEDKAKFKEYQSRIDLGGSHGYNYADLQGKQLEDFIAVSNKVNKLANFAYGLTDNPLGKLVANTYSNLGVDADKEEIERLKEGRSNAYTQDVLATGAGALTGQLANYNIGSKVAQSIPVLQKASSAMGQGVENLTKSAKLGNAAQNIFGDMMLDVALDTAPTTIENAQSGMDAGEVAKEAGKNIGLNLAFNVGGEAISNALPALKKAVDLKSAKSADDILNTNTLKEISNVAPEINPINVGKATTIQSPYKGEVPTQGKNNFTRIEITQESLNDARANIETADIDSKLNGRNPKKILTKVYESLFGESGEAISVPVDKLTFGDKAYNVTVNKNAVGKILSDKNFSAEKLAVIDNIDNVIENSQYVGSGNYINHNNSKKNVNRYDYFETMCKIDGEDYIVSFDVEVVPGSNNYRTHKVINEINLSKANQLSTGTGPVPAVSVDSGKGLFNYNIPNSQNNVNDATAEVVKKFDIKNYPDATDTYKSAKKNIHNMFNMFGSKEQEQTVMNAVNDFVENPSIEKYVELKTMVEKEADSLIGTEYHYKGDKAKKIGKTRKFDKEYDYMSVSDSMDELYNSVRNRSLANKNVSTKTMAEDIGLKNTVTPTASTSSEMPSDMTLEMRMNKYSNDTAINKADYDDSVKKMLIDEPQLYDAARNVDTVATADDIMNNNPIEVAYSEFLRRVEKKDPVAVALGYRLAKQYGASGNADMAVEIVHKMSSELTKSGQFTQAAAIDLMKENPMAAMRFMEKQINKLNQTGAEKFGKKWTDFKLTDDEVKAFSEIEPNDTEAIKELYESISKRIAKDHPATMWEKVVEASKTAMMFNPRTHIRNISANFIMNPMRSLSDRISALGQNAVKLFNPDMTVTQSLIGGTKQQKEIATEIFNKEFLDVLKGTEKWEEASGNIIKNKQVFKDSKAGKSAKKASLQTLNAVNELTNGRLDKLVEMADDSMTGSIMENLRKFNYWLLGDIEDDIFVRKNFTNRLASYMRAQGINSIDDVPAEAKGIAFQEALKATFKDDNNITRAFSGIKKNTGKFGEVLLPFTKTPANIAARGIDYSPAGFINAIKQAKDGGTIADIIDTASKASLGTGAIFLGYLLAKEGMIQGALSSDKDQQQFEKQQGKQAFSINVNGRYYTYDWAQPAAIPIILGSAIYDGIKESDGEVENLLNIGWQATKAGVDAWAGLSPISSLQDILGGGTYSSDSIAENLLNEIVEFPQRLYPSALTATAKTIDPTYRQTYTKGDVLQTQIDTLKSKIPVLSKSLPVSYDTWGNERKRQDSTGSAALANFVNPGTLGYDASTPIDGEINRLFEVTQNKSVFPNKAEWTVKDRYGNSIDLTSQQYSDYQKAMGQTSYRLAEAFMDSDIYNDMSDEDRAGTLSDIYSAVKSMTKNKMFGASVSAENQKVIDAYNANGTQGVINFIRDKHILNSYGLKSNDESSLEFINEHGVDAFKEVSDAIENVGMKQNKENRELYLSGGLPMLKHANNADANNDGKVTKTKELIPYLKMQNWTAEEKNRVVEQFGFSTKGIKW